MNKVLSTLIVIFFISSTLYTQTITTSVIKPPAQLRCNEVPARLNNVVLGAVPPNAGDNPIVVFVHGWFDNGYAWFMAKNKWYENTYNAGYRSAFLFHSYSDEFEKNGKVIADMIRAACRHYNTGKVIAVCHSKGGFDIDYALYNAGIWDTVQGVITLSTPYWGAPMADLIATPIIRSVLENVPIVGPIFRGKGTYQMQTAYMVGVVRPMMDNHPNNRPEKFHCFGAWGYDHKTVLPAAMPDDILKVVFPNYQPLCLDIPGFGTLAGDLMSSFMEITANLSKLVQVQPKYNNPQRNLVQLDGLAPYYSSFRPGSIPISLPPNSSQSYLNHIDVLLSSYMWDIVLPEIDYFKNNPVLRKGKITSPTTEQMEDHSILSVAQLVQSKSIEIDNSFPNTLYLIGDYRNTTIEIFDEADNLISSKALEATSNNMFQFFQEVDLTFLDKNKRYQLKSSSALTGFLLDGKSASIDLNVNADKTYYVDEPLNIEVSFHDWPTDTKSTIIKGFLNRNINEKGEVIWDKLISITFTYDDVSQQFKCNDILNLEQGVYNVSVFAESSAVKRFATTSVLLKQERKSLSTPKGNLSIFPNPSFGEISVEMDINIESVYSVSIFDVSGKNVYQKDLGSLSIGKHQYQFSELSAFSKGIYHFVLYSDNKIIAGKNFVIE